MPGQKLRIEVYRRLARMRQLERLDDFRQELRDRYRPDPEPVEWLLRLAELRLLASRWQIATIHLEGKWSVSEPEALAKHAGTFANASGSEGHPFTAVGPVDLVLEYRHPRKAERLAKREGARLRIVDAQSAYFRLRPEEYEPLALYERIKHLLRLPDRPL